VEYEVKDAVLVLHLSPAAAAAAPSSGGAAPALPWVNLELVGGCSPASYLPASATRQGWKKTRVKKKTSPVVFFYIFAQKREFLGFSSFKNTFRCIQTLNSNHSY
jgi:hypothetical protein